MYIYHVTRPDWLTSNTNRIGFRHYVNPPLDQPFRDHAPLNKAQKDNPEKQVYATFFFDNENTACTVCFELLTLQPHVVLRVDTIHQCFDGFSKANDDRDLTEGAHMWYRADNKLPKESHGSLLHPTWGIPFETVHILINTNGDWEPLNSWLNRARDTNK